MKKLFRFFQFWPYLLLFIFVSLLFLTNSQPGTFFSGWDNLHPEFAPEINLQRSWQGVWQEYQGLGLLAGMAHGADFFRQLFLYPFSKILPATIFRYLFVFLSLLIGVFGAYRAFSFVLEKIALGKSKKAAAFLGASFYLFSLGTLQNFYLAYEPFIYFFTAFPWLVFSIYQYLQTGKKRDLLKFLIISLLATASFYVQTIFIVYFLILILVLFLHLLFSKSKNWKRGLLLIISTLLLNAFWLLPNIYFTISSSQTTIMAKNNQMATEEVFLRNKGFGNLASLARLEGYWFDYQDFTQSGASVYLFDSWKSHLENPFIKLLSYLPFTLLIASLIFFWLRKEKELREWRYSYSIFLFLVYFILTAGNQPFTAVYTWLQESIPLFAQVFRSSFTKWVVPATFIYSLGISFFFYFIFSFLEKKKTLWIRYLSFSFTLLFLASLMAVSWPSFTGNFLYSRSKVAIPEAYFQTFDFFKKVDPNSRIANLPQHSFYGWQWNDWGYRGSGFLWYGIKQPILDRAFDVWGVANEDYYWQVQAAIDAKDQQAFAKVLAKYDVRYLLLDESTQNRNSQKPFNFEDWQEFLQTTDQIEEVASFDFIKIYQFTEEETIQEQAFISLWTDVPSVALSSTYSWQDPAFKDLADYQNSSVDQADRIYPFASLFTNHSQAELPFTLVENTDSFILTSPIPIDGLSPEAYQLQSADFFNTEAFFPVKISWQADAGETLFQIEGIFPVLRYLDQEKTWQWQSSFHLQTKDCLQDESCFLELNAESVLAFSDSGSITTLMRSDLRNAIALKSEVEEGYYDYVFIDIDPQSFQSAEKSLANPATLFQLVLPKVSLTEKENILETVVNRPEAKNCRKSSGTFYKEINEQANLYTANDANSCDSFYLPNLDHKQGYLIRTESQHLDGLPMTFAMQLESLSRSPLETYLPRNEDWQSSSFFLPPIEDFAKGYSLYFSTDAYGRQFSQNALRRASLYYWPYRFNKSLYLERRAARQAKAEVLSCDFQVQKKALWLYQIDLKSCQDQAEILKLSQAYDPAWLALSKRQGTWQVLSHQKFSNWANAWQLSAQEEQIYLIFWPQLLQYLGFLLLLPLPLIFLKKKK